MVESYYSCMRVMISREMCLVEDLYNVNAILNDMFHNSRFIIYNIIII